MFLPLNDALVLIIELGHLLVCFLDIFVLCC